MDANIPDIVSDPCNRQEQETCNNGFKILQWNCNGLSRKRKELVEVMDKRGILIAAFQERKLSSRNPHSCSTSHNVLRKGREKNNGEGIAFLVHSSISFRPLDNFEIQCIAVRSGDVDIEIFNIYIPPVAVCRFGYSSTLDFLLEGQNRIILEDLNAHHDSWFSELECDCRGKHVCRSNRCDSILYRKRGIPDTYHCKLSQVARCHFYKHWAYKYLIISMI